MNPAPSRSATGVARVNPLASMPATLVTPALAIGLSHGVDEHPQRLPIGEHRGDVLEDDTGLGEVRNVANQVR